MPFIKKQEVPNYYVYNEECLNITKCTLSCLDNLGNGNNCKELLKKITICKNDFVKNRKEKEENKLVTVSY
jgi:hypothetical protein